MPIETAIARDNKRRIASVWRSAICNLPAEREGARGARLVRPGRPTTGQDSGMDLWGEFA
eukprot:7553069-Alexandrium_andersonii.AAC.1